jgi:A/G-specific adenine glycosylase
VRRRADKGLLGGMTEVPTTEWSAGFDAAHAVTAAPAFAVRSAGRPISLKAASPEVASLKAASPKVTSLQVSWQRVPGVVTHVFTHFPLELTVLRAHLPQSAIAPEGMRWIARDDISAAALPAVMRKVLAHALASQPGWSEA